MTIKEVHPFEPYIPKNATKLIIGTIPPPRFSENNLLKGDVNFYYGSKDNKFWDIIGKIVQIDFKKVDNETEIKKRKDFLEENEIGICDIVAKTNREPMNSALDQHLVDIEQFNIVNEILVKNPDINTLIYTSEFVKKQMTQLLKTIYKKEICHLSTNQDRRKQLTINGKQYNVAILYSPSPNGNRGIGKNAHEKKLKQYKEFLDI